MEELNPTTIDDLRQLFKELRAVAHDGLFALSPNDSRTAPVDLALLDQVNARLRQVSRLILAAQDEEAR